MVKQNTKATLPKLHNSRADEHWQIVSAHIDFAGKTVIDLGVGHGDLAIRAATAGAVVTGIDKDVAPFLTRAKMAIVKVVGRKRDLDKLKPITPPCDIAFCFSVLPHLKDPTRLLQWMQNNVGTSFVECQYKSDGPGFADIRNDGMMRLWLEAGEWESVENVGKTYIKDRDMYRTVWMCQ